VISVLRAPSALSLRYQARASLSRSASSVHSATLSPRAGHVKVERSYRLICDLSMPRDPKYLDEMLSKRWIVGDFVWRQRDTSP